MSETQETPDPSGQYVQSLARGLSVIRCFDSERPQMTLSEVARETGLTRATARRFLLTLVEIGYVRTDGRQFALTARVLELGYSYLSGLSLPELAQPHLEALSAELHESTSASVLDGHDVVYVARVPTRRIMSVGINLGTRFPAYATSMGRVLLAGLDTASLDRYLSTANLRPLTPATIHDAGQLRAAIERAARDGYASVSEELEIGLRSIAAPVHDRDGRVIAAINVSTQASGTAQMIESCSQALRRTAGAIERDIAAAKPITSLMLQP